MAKKKFTNYKDCIEYLYSLERVGIKYSLKNITTLLEKADNPHLKYKTLHVAGTNGKGSVSSMLNSILMEAGFKTGLYTSPHIKDFRERIRVDGKMISTDYVLDFTNRMHATVEKIKPSFFEVTTAMAFEYFAEKKVKYAVIETGLGGRLDSTNLVKPEITIITSIGIDHTEFLGDTIEKIAGEKAGIIKKGITCVTGKLGKEAYAVIEKKCEEKKAPLINSWKKVSLSMKSKNESGFKFNAAYKSLKLKDVQFPIIGNYQGVNIKTSLAALCEFAEQEKFELKVNDIKEGLKNLQKNSGLHGRFELVHKNPKIIVDTSHNKEALSNLKTSLNYLKYENLYIIVGMMKDKDIESGLNVIRELKGNLIVTKPSYKRAAEPEELMKHTGEKGKASSTPDLKEAIEFTAGIAGKNDLILITGSFFMVSEALEIINKYY